MLAKTMRFWYCVFQFRTTLQDADYNVHIYISLMTEYHECFTTSVRVLETVEGHRSLDYPSWGDVATTTAILSTTKPVVEARGTPVASIRKHKLYTSKLLQKLEDVASYGIFCASGSQVSLVCQSLQLMLLDDSNLNTAHMRADDIDGRWIF